MSSKESSTAKIPKISSISTNSTSEDNPSSKDFPTTPRTDVTMKNNSSVSFFCYNFSKTLSIKDIDSYSHFFFLSFPLIDKMFSINDSILPYVLTLFIAF